MSGPGRRPTRTSCPPSTWKRSTRSNGRSNGGACWRKRTARAEVFVAEAEGKLVGHVAVGRFRDQDNIAQDDIGEVMSIYVVPEHWSTGAGLALLYAGVDRLVEQGLTEMRLWTIADNPRARRFYERLRLPARRKLPPAADRPRLRAPAAGQACSLHALPVTEQR